MTRHLALAVVLLAIGNAQAAEKALDKTFTVASGGSLTVDADGASVRISAGNTSQVVVHMSARGSEDDIADVKLEAVQNNDGVAITMRRPDKRSWFRWGSWSSEEKIEVTVPRQYQVNVRTGGGNVELGGTTGTARLQTSGGDVSARNITGNIELRTSGGGIVADTIRGDVDANTSGGDVRLLKIDGKIRGNTSGGSVRCSLVGANRGISATSSGGDIELTLPRATTGDVNATTSGGGIDLDLPITTSEHKDGRVRGTLNGGGLPIEARTSGGNVSLRAAD
ncbi:MAG TPA: DUF4097 family beta strand repeat-containing protein [Steroidobacteraceae bacterium]|nr:DUF4097 family beta strand repeat-containing protein [Steroidobacteraceae bacterium]